MKVQKESVSSNTNTLLIKRGASLSSLEDYSPDAWTVWIALWNHLESATVIWNTELGNSSLFPTQGSNIHVVLYIPWVLIWLITWNEFSVSGEEDSFQLFTFSILSWASWLLYTAASLHSPALETAHVFDLLMTFFNFLLCRAKCRVLRRVSLLFRTL